MVGLLTVIFFRLDLMVAKEGKESAPLYLDYRSGKDIDSFVQQSIYLFLSMMRLGNLPKVEGSKRQEESRLHVLFQVFLCA